MCAGLIRIPFWITNIGSPSPSWITNAIVSVTVATVAAVATVTANATVAIVAAATFATATVALIVALTVVSTAAGRHLALDKLHDLLWAELGMGPL